LGNFGLNERVCFLSHDVVVKEVRKKTSRSEQGTARAGAHKARNLLVQMEFSEVSSSGRSKQRAEEISEIGAALFVLLYCYIARRANTTSVIHSCFKTLRCSEVAPLAHGQMPEVHAADAHPFETSDEQADLLAHAANLVFCPL
jgi:hypothetical protein